MDAALDQAILVFRERGYHGTSISELAKAMGLTVGSIYKAFPDKRAIFLAAYQRYTQQRQQQLRERLAVKQSGLDKLRALMIFYVEAAQGLEGQRGCLVVGSAIELSILDSELAEHIQSTFRRNESLLLELILQGQEDGSISQALDAMDAARFLLSFLQGLRVVGKTGRTCVEMEKAAEFALRALD